MDLDIQRFHLFVYNYTLSVVVAVLSLICLILHFKFTSRSRRWTTPFNLAFLLLTASTIYFVCYAVYFLNAYRFGSVSVAAILANISSDLQLLFGELALSWMVYRIYPRRIFRKVVGFIIVFILLRTSIFYCFFVKSFIAGKEQHTFGIIFAVLLMWNCVFFSGLFISRFRKKLKCASHNNRLLKTIFNLSIKNAIIPSLLVMGPLISLVLPKTRAVKFLQTALVFIFRIAYGTFIAYSLHLINRDRSQRSDNTGGRKAVGQNARLTTFHFVSSFGVERRIEIIMEDFLAQVYDIFRGDIGYFVEKNRYGQLSVICGFSFIPMDGNVEIQLFSPKGDHNSEIPIAALECALDLHQMNVVDFKMLDDGESEFCTLLGDRISSLDSVLILPVTSPSPVSYKNKILYIERYSEYDTFTLSNDLHALEPLTQQFAASLECARLFSELEDINRALDQKVQERTAEVELKNVHLEKAKKEALQAANAKSEFLSNMSHEIRTPISQVILASELLADTNLTNEAREYSNVITNSGKLLLSLVNDILDCSKLENGKIIIEEIEFDLFQTIQISVDAFSTEKDIWLGYYVPPEFQHVVVGDATRIRQIVTNLISNAIKFTTRGYVLLYVSYEQHKEGTMDVGFKVIDTGVGIAEGKRQAIFERFEQETTSTSRTYGGTGLGLSICQGLCTLMGSSILVTSDVGKGSTFEFRIPFRIPSNMTLPVYSELSHVLTTEPRILVVEETVDCYNSKRVLDYQLETMGAVVESAAFSSQLASLHQCYELIVIDITNSKASEVQTAVSVCLSSSKPVLLIHNRDQTEFTNELLLGSHQKNAQSIAHPYRQSSLFRTIKQMIELTLFRTPLSARRIESTAVSIDEQSAIGKQESAHGMQSTMQLKAPINILLVEDNLINQKVLRAMLNKLGYNVDMADNGLIAVNMAKENDYDLILMDMRMPVMDGREATQKIRSYYLNKNHSHENSQSVSQPHRSETILDTPSVHAQFIEAHPAVPNYPFIVGLSADALVDKQREGLDAGLNMYLTKPVSSYQIKELLSLVVTTLDYDKRGSGVEVAVNE